MNIDTHFDYNYHIAFISTHTNTVVSQKRAHSQKSAHPLLSEMFIYMSAHPGASFV